MVYFSYPADVAGNMFYILFAVKYPGFLRYTVITVFFFILFLFLFIMVSCREFEVTAQVFSNVVVEVFLTILESRYCPLLVACCCDPS